MRQGLIDFRSGESDWPPRQESNLYRTLRRRVHYPLCYEEAWGGYAKAAILA